jgi:short-subunit dehydrogenase
LAQYDHFEVLAQQVAAKFGRIDILVNNGGISQRSYFKDTQFSVLRQIMETNFMGNVALTRAVLPHLIEQGGGSIAVVSSVTGKFGTPLRTFYAASKHALHGFYDALRAEMHEQNIHILMVCPGYIKTNLSYNALLGDGSPQNRLDPGQASGISAHDCALAIMKGLKGKKREVYPAGAKELLGVFLSRFFPGILAKMVRKVNVR